VSPELDPTGFTDAEREVLDVARGSIEASGGLLDDRVLTRIKEALLQIVSFDRIALHVEDEGGSSFWVMWRDTATGGAPQAFATGLHMPRDERVAARRDRGRGEPSIIEELLPDESATEAALYATGVRSYVVFPIMHQGADVGWITLVHNKPGAPSQVELPLLRVLGRSLGAALVRTRAAMRGNLFAALVDASPDGMLALDGAGTVIEVNRAGLRLLGRSRGGIVGKSAAELFGGPLASALTSPWTGEPKTVALEPHEERPGLDLVIAQVAGGSEAIYQIHVRDARGRRAAEEASARRVEHLAFLRGLSESVAGDLRVRAALERAASFCAGRAEVGGVVVFRAEEDGNLSLVASRGISDRTARRLARVSFKDLETTLDANAANIRRAHGVVEAVGAALDPETTGLVPRWKILVPLAHARRAVGAMLVMGRPGATLHDPERDLWESVGGTLSAALHAADDFERVVALEAEKRQLVDSLPVIVARLDPKTGATLFVNGAIERILGYGATEVLGTPGLDGLLADPIEWEASAVARDRAARGREGGWQDRRYQHKDGRVLTLRESVYPVQDATGSVRAIEVIAYDVTTELESRKQLMQADRLASLGALAGGIAHEINNPVAFIGLAAGQLLKMLDANTGGDPKGSLARAHQLLEEVAEAAARIGNIVGELKLFTRIPEGALATPVDLNRMVQMAVTLSSAELRKRARVEMNLGELPLVPGEYASLGQALVNLLLNAAQAIYARHDAGPRADLVRVATFVADGAIVVRVSDTGVGIEPRLLPRIFDPFFKTRAAGEGAGLGLAIAHNLVRRVGGDIRVHSELGEGTTFDVVLPLETSKDVPRPAPSGMLRAAPAVASAKEGSRGRVLIVDDEQALANALARQLAERWDVDTVSTARDALAELSVHRYDVVACDLRMPDQSGPAIYEAIRARSPRQAARFVFTTGGSYGMDDDEIHARAEASGRPILEKPFDGATFEALVAKVAAGGD
jgi:PAS domain S-box-containing protein